MITDHDVMCGAIIVLALYICFVHCKMMLLKQQIETFPEGERVLDAADEVLGHTKDVFLNLDRRLVRLETKMDCDDRPCCQ